MRFGILGATGYTGGELIRLLLNHPYGKITYLTADRYAGKQLGEVFPQFRTVSELTCQPLVAEQVIDHCDLVFSALPHGLSMNFVGDLIKAGKRVVDLSADYRLRDSNVYQSWYGLEHKNKELLGQAVYGLPEINRKRIAGASLIANPGCYPTSILLPLAPLLREKAVEKEGIIVDAKSGVSGAGRSLSLNNHYCEAEGSLHPYQVGGIHRHLPEIEQELSLAAGAPLTITFTPHLIPMSRGMLSTIYLYPKEGIDEEKIRTILTEVYGSEPFVHLLPKGEFPKTKAVAGTNHCLLSVHWDSRTGRLIICSAIDNLIKGASGQAVQNANLICGFPEDTGLKQTALYP
jgi:N-acetyl-gamma-glutamyl-phosphate reductase